MANACHVILAPKAKPRVSVHFSRQNISFGKNKKLDVFAGKHVDVYNFLVLALVFMGKFISRHLALLISYITPIRDPCRYK